LILKLMGLTYITIPIPFQNKREEPAIIVVELGCVVQMSQFRKLAI
jgi:hypothetical protein